MQVRNSRIQFDNFDSVGISLHSLKHANIDGVQMDTLAEASRALALGEGLVLSENLRVSVQRIDVTGFRLGMHLSNQFSELNRIFVDSCSFKSCGIGVLLRDATKSNNGAVPPPAALAADKSSTNQEHYFSRLQFDTTHYGIYNDDPRARIEVACCEFDDVPRPIILDRDCLPKTHVHDGVYKVSESFLPVEGDGESSSGGSNNSSSSGKEDFEAITGKMYLHFATKENLPHRSAIDYNRVTFIHCEREEKMVEKKFKAFREQPKEQEE